MADLGAYQALMAPGEEPTTLVDLLYGSGRPSWFADAACKEHPELSWHPELGESTAPAKRICSGCLVRAECFDYALADPALAGVWGGLSARERGRLRRGRSRPDAA